MKDSVIVNGVTLTRKQIEEATRELERGEAVTLKTGGIRHMIPLSNGSEAELRNENGSCQGKGLYLSRVIGHRWAVKTGIYKDNTLGTWQVLVLEPING